MKMIVAVALALVAAAAALPVQEEPIPILRSESDQSPEGAFRYSFETGNGITAEAAGELRTVPDEDNKPREVVVIRGQYSYPSEDGKPILVTYYADETGYHAEGDSIPKPASRR